MDATPTTQAYVGLWPNDAEDPSFLVVTLREGRALCSPQRRHSSAGPAWYWASLALGTSVSLEPGAYHMSLSHKLLTIETSIAFEDVQDSWRFEREVWMCEVVKAMAEPQKLAILTLQLLSALTPGCVAYYWKKPSDFKRLSEAAGKLASTNRDAAGRALKVIIAEVEDLIVDENETDHTMLSNGTPDEFAIGETGPELQANEVCGALDIRMAWCPAQVVQRRLGPGGVVQYRVNYDGWNKRWDEWVARDSGRVRSELPSTNPPQKIDEATAKTAKETAKEAATQSEMESKVHLKRLSPPPSPHFFACLAALALHRCACATDQKASSSASGSKKAATSEAGPSDSAAQAVEDGWRRAS